MPQFKSVERLSLIINFINNRKYPSMPDILDYLTEKDLEPTERTVQRDLKTLRDLCFIEVKYSRSNQGYFIDEESRKEYENWMHVFELFNTARVINDALVKSSTNIEYIDFDRSTTNLTDEILGDMLKAVTDKRKISFDHQSFWNSEVKRINLYPHLLKQYQNRWYVFGCFPNGEFRSFGLERISNLELKTDTFKPKMKDPKKAFNEIVGLVYSLTDIEKVVLSYTAHQGRYIKTQPVHASQKILIDDEKELRIELKVRPNYELQEQILKQGERVKVLEPEWLRQEIRERLRQALEKY